jgi:hypothetical protein
MSSTECQSPHDLTHMWNLKTLISQKLRIQWWLPKAGNREQWEGVVQWVLSYS